MVENTEQYKWYDKHREHVTRLITLEHSKGYKPSIEDWLHPELWKPQHWKWYVTHYNQIEEDCAEMNKTPMYVSAKLFDRTLEYSAHLHGFQDYSTMNKAEIEKWKCEREERLASGFYDPIKIKYGIAETNEN